MLHIKNLPSFLYKKATSFSEISEQIIALESIGWTVDNLGLSSDGVNPIYGVHYGDLNNKPTIYVDGTIHGAHEWRCTHWVIQFAKVLANPNVFPEHKEWINKLKNKFSFYFIPCLNPYGYLNNDYKNANGVNLNRNYEPIWKGYNAWSGWGGGNDPIGEDYKGPSAFSEVETQYVKGVWELYKPSIYVNLHTHGGFEKSLLQIEYPSRDKEQLFVDLVKSLNLSINTIVNETSLTASRPRAGEWGATQRDKRGEYALGIVYEAGDLNGNEKIGELAITALLLICIYLYENHENGKIVL